MNPYKKIKIVATMGPSSTKPEIIREMILAGMNVCRLNFSHGTQADHANMVDNIRKVARELKVDVAILQDLQGPKVRVGKFEKGSIEIASGDRVTITTKKILGKEGLIPTDVETLASDVEVGHRILLDDGLMELEVLATNKKDSIECGVVYGGVLKDRKGMNLPQSRLSVDCLTEKDLSDVAFAAKLNLDYVALSFVRTAEDIHQLRRILEEHGSRSKIIAKIEMREAVKNLEEIIAVSDGVMVARGDLAIEVGQTLLPGLQKRIIKTANRLKKPVITATQMLDSMVSNPRPTRAEVTDVANAILDGTDACMLSAESASGQYPVRTIETMNEIASQVEKDQLKFYRFPKEQKDWSLVSEAIAESACVTAKMLDAKAIICLSTTGKTATLISSFRPKAPIVSVTHVEEGLTALQLNWGIHPMKISPYTTGEEAMREVENLLLERGFLSKGDKVVLTLGFPVASRAKTNALRVHIVD